MFLLSLAAVPLLAVVAVQPPKLIILPAGSRALDVSDDGSVVVGANAANAFRWTLTEGLVEIPGAAVSGGAGVSVSGDGGTLASDLFIGTVMYAARSTGAGWTALPDLGGSCDAFGTSAFDVNVDGNVVVGLAWKPACKAIGFRWDPVAGTVELPSTVVNRPTRGNAVNGVGDVVVGWQDLANGTRQGARWNNLAQTLFNYTAPSGTSYPCGEALSVNDPGNVAAGYQLIGLPGGANKAWRWDAITNQTTLLANLNGFGTSPLPLGITDDGTTIVGTTGGFPFGRQAIVWTADGVAQNLLTILQAAGTPGLAGITGLGTANAVSDDGRVIVGWGAGPGQPSGWIVQFPAPCDGDINGDGLVDATDLASLLAQWGGAGSADLNGSGTVDAADLSILLAGWGKCP